MLCPYSTIGLSGNFSLAKFMSLSMQYKTSILGAASPLTPPEIPCPGKSIEYTLICFSERDLDILLYRPAYSPIP